jgi:hypothetical protein
MPQVWCVVRPNLSTLDCLRTAISENQMREDFTQADRVAALDALQALVEDAGLRGTSRALGISAGWLSRQLSLRRDPVLFPALEAGQVTFAQADEIRRGPAHLRQTLVDRAIQDDLPSTELRSLVATARASERQARSVQRERVAISRADASDSLQIALDLLLAQSTPSIGDCKVLLQIREVVNHLLDQGDGVRLKVQNVERVSTVGMSRRTRRSKDGEATRNNESTAAAPTSLGVAV